ncbi:hypothetical protein P2318_28815 [Myxococcaceae bacterium GXIMD 01537]
MNQRLLRLSAFLCALGCSACGLLEKEEVNCATALCMACAPPLTVRVSGTSGQPPPLATLEGERGSCESDAAKPHAVCSISADRAGTFEFDIKAPGYQTAHVRETVRSVEPSDGCCTSCGYESRVVDVTLTPE